MKKVEKFSFFILELKLKTLLCLNPMLTTSALCELSHLIELQSQQKTIMLFITFMNESLTQNLKTELTAFSHQVPSVVNSCIYIAIFSKEPYNLPLTHSHAHILTAASYNAWCRPDHWQPFWV